MTATSAWSRLFERAHVGHRGDARRRATTPRGRPRRWPRRRPTARSAGPRPRPSPTGLAPGPAHPGLHLNTLLARQGHRRPPARATPRGSPSRNLVQRGQRRVGAGARRRGEGRYDLPQRWYRLKAGLLGVDRLADYDRMAARWPPRTARSAGRGHGAGARRLRRRSRPSWPTSPAASSTSAGSTPPAAPGKRPGRLLRLHRPVPPPVRVPQLDRPAARRRSPWPTSSATACTPTWPGRRACSTSRRR